MLMSSGALRLGRQGRYRPPRCLGFTLRELLVVVVIIALLASYVGPRYFGQLGKSEVSVAKAQIDAFGKALDAYRIDLGHYPSTEEGLGALFKAPADAAKWSGPYLKGEPPKGPWGNACQYRPPSSSPGKDFDLFSLGKDGKPGGGGEAADILN